MNNVSTVTTLETTIFSTINQTRNVGQCPTWWPCRI